MKAYDWNCRLCSDYIPPECMKTLFPTKLFSPGLPKEKCKDPSGLCLSCAPLSSFTTYAPSLSDLFASWQYQKCVWVNMSASVCLKCFHGWKGWTMKVSIQTKKGHKIIDINRRKAIQERCLNCSGFIDTEVRDCTHTDCDLYLFRLGKGKQNDRDRTKAITNIKL